MAVRFAPRTRTSVQGRVGMIVVIGILSSGIINKNRRVLKSSFVGYFFKKLLLFRYFWCIIRVSGYPAQQIRSAMYRSSQNAERYATGRCNTYASQRPG